MRTPFIAVIFALALAACSDLTKPAGSLDGSWRAWSYLPSGAYSVLSLRQQGSAVTGTIREYFGAQSQVADSGQVVGTLQDGTVDLQLQYTVAGTARFSGAIVSADTLRGTTTPPSGTPHLITFAREVP